MSQRNLFRTLVLNVVTILNLWAARAICRRLQGRMTQWWWQPPWSTATSDSMVWACGPRRIGSSKRSPRPSWLAAYVLPTSTCPCCPLVRFITTCKLLSHLIINQTDSVSIKPYPPPGGARGLLAASTCANGAGIHHCTRITVDACYVHEVYVVS